MLEDGLLDELNVLYGISDVHRVFRKTESDVHLFCRKNAFPDEIFHVAHDAAPCDFQGLIADVIDMDGKTLPEEVRRPARPDHPPPEDCGFLNLSFLHAFLLLAFRLPVNHDAQRNRKEKGDGRRKDMSKEDMLVSVGMNEPGDCKHCNDGSIMG